ncbi:MAG: hypothetical protein ACE5OR_09385, partial [bacterium]
KILSVVLAVPFVAFFTAYLPDGAKILKNIFQWGFIPDHFGAPGRFAGEPWYFYFKQLIGYSPLYIFAFLSLFLLRCKQKRDFLMILCSGGLLAFFILWGAFQCRYILPAIPFLIVLSARTQIFLHDWLKRYLRSRSKLLIWILFIILSYFYIKTVWTDFAFALPNKAIFF